MTDIVSPETRSKMMSRIRGRDTSPELTVRRFLHAVGLRFRLHAKDLPGRPDIVLPGRRAAVFVHGCFWHQHPGCREAVMPSTRPEFWKQKFAANQARDARSIRLLEEAGWNTFVLWECEARDELALENLAWLLLALPEMGPQTGPSK
ncbi:MULTISPECIES: very short patch repair endonuclease [unclassified Roseateles]|uniref:very short patch repair endonuclease n=1 Tax=unclassified Roseateles TaxID=2626991 RepID=UPI001609C5D0|nr:MULTISPECIES: very short patch repair endonuclease [unclassified Roseateles]